MLIILIPIQIAVKGVNADTTVCSELCDISFEDKPKSA